MIIKFTQRDGYGSSIEFIERRGSDGADVDEKNNGFGVACRNSKRLVEYIGGFAAVQTFVSKTTYLTSAPVPPSVWLKAKLLVLTVTSLLPLSLSSLKPV